MEDEHVPPVPIQNVANNNIIDVCDVVEREPTHVTHEDRLLIRLTSLLTDANVPLYLADSIVEIFCDETEHGFIFDSSLLSKC